MAPFNPVLIVPVPTLKPASPARWRNVLSSGYNVFKSKTSGKLAILAELLSIDSYSVTHKVEEVKNSSGNVVIDTYNVIIYPEISCDETEQKYGIRPELSYYLLKES